MQGPTEESQIITELKKQYDVVEVDPVEADHQEVRRAAGRAAVVALARGDGELRPVREVGPADRDLRGSAPLAQLVRRRRRHRPAEAAARRHDGHVRRPAAAGTQGRHHAALAPAWASSSTPTRSSGKTSIPRPRSATSPKSGSSSTKGSRPRTRSIRSIRSIRSRPACGRCCSWSAGAWRPEKGSKLKFTELAHTGPNTGTITFRDYEMWNRSGGTLQPRRNLTHDQYIIAARVQGTVVDDNDLFVSDTKDKSETTKAADAAKESRSGRAPSRQPIRPKQHDPAEDPDQSRPEEEQHRRRPGLRHRLDRADHLPAPRDGPEPGHAHRLEVPECAVRAEHPRFARRRRPLRRHPQADPRPPHPHQDRGSHRRVSGQVARRAEQVHGRSQPADRNGAATVPRQDRRAGKTHRPRRPHQGPADRDAADRSRSASAT